LQPGRHVAPLTATGFVEDAHSAQGVRGQFGERDSKLPLQEVTHVVVVPTCGGQELLECSHGGSGFEGDRFDSFSRQVGEQASTVIVKVGGGAFLEKATAEASQISSESWPQAGNFLFSHWIPSRITNRIIAYQGIRAVLLEHPSVQYAANMNM